MSEPQTLVLVDDDGPTTVDPRFARGPGSTCADPVDPNRKTWTLVSLVLGAALIASGVVAYRQHRRADRLADALAFERRIESARATPGTAAVHDGTDARTAKAHRSTTIPSSGAHRDVPAADTARLEALAAKNVVLGDYRTALHQYRALAEGPTNPSVFADLVAVLELELGCIEAEELGGRMCD